MKYFAGAGEDHTGKIFDGITGYTDVDHVETFGKTEIRKILKKVGFNQIEFYYPYPDYKFPIEIFSDEFMPDIDNVLFDAPNYDKERLRLFSEKKAFFDIIRNGQFDFFSNSFLIIASKEIVK